MLDLGIQALVEVDKILASLKPFADGPYFWTQRERCVQRWPYGCEQIVSSKPAVEDYGVNVYKLCGVTKMLRNVQPLSANQAENFAEAAAYASSFGLVVDEKRATLQACSTAYVHEQNLQWLPQLFAHSLMEQAIRVPLDIATLARLLNAEPEAPQPSAADAEALTNLTDKQDTFPLIRLGENSRV
jgi:hypothetical protein